MNLIVKNCTTYKKIKVVCNQNQAILNKDEKFIFNIDTNEIELMVFIIDKNRVLFNLLFALIDGFISEESVVNVINCNASFTFSFADMTKDEFICIDDLETRDGNQCVYNSVYLKSNNIATQHTNYHLTETKKQKKKSLFYHIFITSHLPTILFLLIYSICSGNVFALIASILILITFSIPSWKKASKLKIIYSDLNANKVLSVQEQKQRQNNGSPPTEIPSDIIGKAVYNILDKILKKNKNK